MVSFLTCGITGEYSQSNALGMLLPHIYSLRNSSGRTFGNETPKHTINKQSHFCSFCYPLTFLSSILYFHLEVLRTRHDCNGCHTSHLHLPHPRARALEQTLAERLEQMLITVNAEIKPRRISNFLYAFQINPIPIEQGLIITAS